MMEREIGGFTYRARKLSAREQFQLVLRVAPIFGDLAPQADSFQGGEEAMLQALPAFTRAIGSLPPRQSDWLLCGLLSAVDRKEAQGLGWSPVCAGVDLLDEAQHKPRIMYADVEDDLRVTMQLAWLAFRANLGGFFGALPSVLPGGSLKQNAPAAG